MDPHHRKIELQSPEDLAYLVDNVRRAAAESVQAAFPPVEVPEEQPQPKSLKKKRRVAEDDLHTRVEALVTEYISRTFALAAPNLSINGQTVDLSVLDNKEKEEEDSSEPPQEPFDTRKRQRVEDLARDEEDLLRDIALLKRRVPAAAVRAREQALAGALAADAAAVAALGEVGEVAGVDLDEDEVDGDAADTDDPAAAYASAVAGLGRLKQAMPATVARMERARVAADYAVKER